MDAADNARMNELARFHYRVTLLIAILVLVLVHAP
jgi:hypothetical protein